MPPDLRDPVSSFADRVSLLYRKLRRRTHGSKGSPCKLTSVTQERFLCHPKHPRI